MEGVWNVEQTVWGVNMNTETRTTSLPPVRLVKASYILADPELDPGFEHLKLRTVQVLRGNLQAWKVVLAAVAPEMGVCDRLLGLGQRQPGPTKTLRIPWS